MKQPWKIFTFNKMIKIKIRNLLFIIFPVSMLLAGCEKIIDVDLNEADTTIVIEGNLSFNDRTVKVLLSETGSYFTPGETQKVSGAIVSLEDDKGNLFTVDEKEEGLYINNKINVRPDTRYKLSVTHNGTEYSASSFLNPPVYIDSTGYEKYNSSFFYEEGYRIKVFFKDPPGIENYYRINLFKNGELLSAGNDLIVFDDSGIDGKIVQVRLGGQRFDKNDKAYLEMLVIDKPVWKYLSTLRDVANINPGSPAPANPVSNFNNGALGYFSAWSYDSKSIIIK